MKERTKKVLIIGGNLLAVIAIITIIGLNTFETSSAKKDSHKIEDMAV